MPAEGPLIVDFLAHIPFAHTRECFPGAFHVGRSAAVFLVGELLLGKLDHRTFAVTRRSLVIGLDADLGIFIAHSMFLSCDTLPSTSAILLFCRIASPSRQRSAAQLARCGILSTLMAAKRTEARGVQEVATT